MHHQDISGGKHSRENWKGIQKEIICRALKRDTCWIAFKTSRAEFSFHAATTLIQ